jgi:excisionase family DNA binding protein
MADILQNPFQELSTQLSEIKTLLLDTRSRNQVVPEKSDQLLNIHQAAELLDVSTSTIYGWTHANQIPFLKPCGKKIFFSRDELLLWVKASRRTTNSEIASDAVVNLKRKRA